MAPRSGHISQSHRPTIVLVVLLLVSLVTVTLYVREGETGTLHDVQHNVSGLFAPLKVASGGISAAEERITRRIEDAQADPNSIVELRQQNEQLRATIAELEEFRQEALRLEGLLEMKSTYAAQGIPARVLARSTDAWNRVLTIDAGSADGVRAGLPVMGASGLIGQVIATTEHNADIRLLTDSQSGVAVLIQSSREEGIVHGSLEGLLYLEDLGDDVEVKPGDVVLTSGLGGGYFRGIIVGTILKVEGEAGATSRKIIVEPNGGVDPLEEVYVVTSMTSKAADPKESQTDDASAQSTQGTQDLDGDGIPDGYYDPNAYSYDAASYDMGTYTEGGYDTDATQLAYDPGAGEGGA